MTTDLVAPSPAAPRPPAEVAPPGRAGRLRASVRGVAGDTWENFVSSDLEGGLIRTKGLGAGMAALTATASLVFFALVGLFLTNQFWRSRYPLVPVGNDLPGRGAFVPAPLLPVVFFLLAFALALLLAGALHAAWWVRVAVLVVYLAVGSSASIATHGGVATAGQEWGGRALLALVPVVFALRWRAPSRPAAEFAVLFGLVCGNILLGLEQLARLDRVGNAALSAQLASAFIVGLGGLLGPRLVMAGLDTVAFGASVSLWALQVIDRRVHVLASSVALAAFGAWRLRDTVVDLAATTRAEGVDGVAWHLAGGGLLVAVVAGTWFVLDALADRAGGEEATDPDVVAGAKRLVLPLGAAYLGAVTGLGVVAVVAAGIDAQSGAGRARWSSDVGGLIRRYNEAATDRWWPAAFAAVLLLASVVLVRRPGARTISLVVAEVGAVGVWSELTGPGRPLHLVGSGPTGTDPWIVATAVGLTAWWTWRRRMDRHRVARLLFVLLLSGLVKQADFLGNPFELVLGFAGVGFVAFGMVWGYLTAGAWTNTASVAFPRPSRILLFLGYTIFTLTVGTWFVLSHDLGNTTLFSDSWAGLGRQLFGEPLLLTLVVVTLVGTATSRHFGAAAPQVAATTPEPHQEPTDVP